MVISEFTSTRSQLLLEGKYYALFEDLLSQLAATWQPVPDKADENPWSTLCSLWHSVSARPGEVQTSSSENLPILNNKQIKSLRNLVDRRISGVPLAYLIGHQSFMGLQLMVGPEALIPRQETEILAKAALSKLRETVINRGRAKVIDLCTGSGNLALALAFNEPDSTVVGSDISKEAIELARRNAARLGLSDRVTFEVGDFLSPFESEEFLGNSDLVVCNPPYVSTAKVSSLPYEVSGFEPKMAFDGGPFGVKILTRLVREAHRFLKPVSWLCFEVGVGQGKATAQMLRGSTHYSLVEECTDEKGEMRVLLART